MIKRLLARLSRKASSPKNRYYDDQQHPIRRHHISKNAVQVVRQLTDHGHHAYVVGGCLRDILLQRQPKDFDVATDATPEQVKQIFRRARIVGRRFQIVHVYFGREIIEVTTFRGHHGNDTGNRFSQQSESGMLIRDNVYGSIEEDAVRRDFTANSLYFDPLSETLVDFVGGVRDLRERRLVTIGDPEQRFREDPVRMLRAVRFEAMLGLDLDRRSREEIASNAAHIREVAPARLFDELIKLFLGGHGARALELLVDHGLFDHLFPATAGALADQPEPGTALLRAAVGNTDIRVQDDKPVTPAFLFGALLWPAVDALMQRDLAAGRAPAEALNRAAGRVVAEQLEVTQIPKRFSIPMREIWELQARLHLRAGKRAERLVEQQRFRAAYDFILLREQAGEDLDGLGAWWTEYQDAPAEQRQEMADRIQGGSGSGRSKRRRPRRRKPRSDA